LLLVKNVGLVLGYWDIFPMAVKGLINHQVWMKFRDVQNCA